MTRHVLAALDLTHGEDARALVAEAGRLAGFYGAELSAMTVLPDYRSGWVASFFEEGRMEEAIAAANAELHALVAEVLPGRTVRHIVATGVAYEEVLRATGEVGADMVVVGAHKPDLAARLMGPNAARIARHAPVSVVVLRL